MKGILHARFGKAGSKCACTLRLVRSWVAVKGTMILGFERSGQTGNNRSSRWKPPSFVLRRGQTCGYNDVTGDQPPLDGWPPLYLYQPTYHPSRRGVIYCPTPSLQPESALSRTRTPNRNLHRGVVGLWGASPLARVLRSSALGTFDASRLRSRSPSDPIVSVVRHREPSPQHNL